MLYMYALDSKINRSIELVIFMTELEQCNQVDSDSNKLPYHCYGDCD